MSYENVNKFKDAMAEDGFSPGDLEPDGAIHRFSVNGRRDRSAWYCLFSDPWAGAYGDWRADSKFTWSAVSPSTMSDVERNAFHKRMKKAQDERERLRKEAHAEAAKKARRIWDKAIPATAENAYLKQKGLKPYGDIKQYGKALVVPVRGLDGRLYSLQFIGPDGEKRFLADGQVQGCCSWIKGDGKTLVAEGWATAASLYMATGCNVVSCFNAGNLGAVVEALLESKPGIEIILCADNDQFNDVNVGIDKAQVVAKKHNLKMAIPTFKDLSTKPTDFDDLRRLEGIEEVKRQVEAASDPQADEWPEPEHIKAELSPVEVLRAEMIPSPFLPMVKDVSHRMAIPMDYVAVPLVVVAGSVIGTGCRIRPKRKDDWQIVSNLWGGLLGPPSRLKSPALEETSKKILGRLEAEAAEDFEQQKTEWMNECRGAKLSQEVLQSEYKGAYKAQRSGKEGRSPDEILEELRQLEESTIEPVERRYKTNDATVEKIVELLAQNPRGLLYYRDELVGLFKRMDKPGYEQDRAFFLEAWSGNGSHVDDRIGRGTKRADNLCLSFLGSIQPSKLAGYLRQALSETENDGFIQRVQLMVYPDMPKYHHVDQWPDSESRHRAYAIIKRLANMDFTDPGFETEDGVSFLRFDDQAQDIFNEWYQDLMGKLEGDEHPAILEHFGKYRSLMPSLALIFHLVEIADGQAQVGPVSKHCAIQAAAWCEYLESHARRIYSMVLNGVSLAAGALSTKLLDRKLEGPFKVWHIQTKGWGLLTDNVRIRDAVTFLQDAGWVRELPKEGGKVGRPKDAEYEVNPKIFENGQEQAQVNQVN